MMMEKDEAGELFDRGLAIIALTLEYGIPALLIT